MIKPPAFVTLASGIGDLISSTPLIRKLSEVYNKKVLVVTEKCNIKIFQTLPYVSGALPFDNTSNIVRADIKHLYDIHETFRLIGKRNKDGIEFKHAMCDIRQFHAKDLGLLLRPDELHCDYIPGEDVSYFETLNLPENYIVIHPVKSWKSRTWEAKKWQKLCDSLAEEGIYVVAVGKEAIEYRNIEKTKVINKPSHDISLNFGVNLINKTNLDQTWYILNNAKAVITMDSGILHLAGTTDTHIIQLGSSIDPVYRAPYRNGTQEYKYTYLPGTCNIHCASDLKYSLRDWGNIQRVTIIDTCLEKDKNFECKPGVDHVINNTIGIYKKLII